MQDGCFTSRSAPLIEARGGAMDFSQQGTRGSAADGRREAMLRIRDMPRGGGSAAGREVWFALLTQDGCEFEFNLGAEQVEAFIAGLRTFELEAAGLAARSGVTPRRPAYLTADRFEVAVAPDGTLELALGDSARGQVRAAVPALRIKPLLVAILTALSRRPGPV